LGFKFRFPYGAACGFFKFVASTYGQESIHTALEKYQSTLVFWAPAQEAFKQATGRDFLNLKNDWSKQQG